MIPLLSPKALSFFSPEEFKLYVVSLYHKPEPAPAKVKKLREYKVSAKVLKSGLISVTTKREPKYVTEGEFAEICGRLDRTENEVFICLQSKGFLVRSHEEAERIAAELKGIPW